MTSQLYDFDIDARRIALATKRSCPALNALSGQSGIRHAAKPAADRDLRLTRLNSGISAAVLFIAEKITETKRHDNGEAQQGRCGRVENERAFMTRTLLERVFQIF
jgi:hypothetical protein